MTAYRQSAGTVDVISEHCVAWWRYSRGKCVMCDDDGDSPRDAVFLRPKPGVVPFYVCITCIKTMWTLRPVAEEVAP